MAITVDYGPISAAMNLAGQAGANQGRQLGFQDDMSLLNYTVNAQRLAQSQRAQDIQAAMQGDQLGLEAQRNQATQNLAQQQLAAQTAYQQANLNSLNSYRQNQGNVAQQNAASKAQQVANQGDYYQGRVDAMGQNADTLQQARLGMLQVAQQNAATRGQQVQNQNVNTQNRNDTAQQEVDTKSLVAEAQALGNYVKQHDQSLGDPNDPDYQQAKARLNQISQVMQQRNASILTGQRNVPARLVAQPQNPQQAQPGSAPSNPVQVTSDADYSKLPAGAYFTGPDGVLRQKP